MGNGRRIVEAPPEEYRSGPTVSGKTTERIFDNFDEMQRFCRENGVSLGHNPGRGAYFQACYVPSLDVVALPSRKAWPSQREIDELREHEWAHARGWRHSYPLNMKKLTAEYEARLAASQNALRPEPVGNALKETR